MGNLQIEGPLSPRSLQSAVDRQDDGRVAELSLPGGRLCQELTRLSIPFRVDGALSDLDLSGASLSDEVLSRLLSSLDAWPAPLRTLNLRNNQLSNAAARALVHIAHADGASLTVDLSDNRITDAAASFGAALPEHVSAVQLAGNPLIEPPAHFLFCHDDAACSPLRRYLAAAQGHEPSCRVKLVVVGAAGCGKSVFIEACFGAATHPNFKRPSHVAQTFYWSTCPEPTDTPSSESARSTPLSSSTVSSSSPSLPVPPLSLSSSPPGSSSLAGERRRGASFGLKDAIQSIAQTSPTKLMATLTSPRRGQQHVKRLDFSVWEAPSDCQLLDSQRYVAPPCRAVYVCLFRAALTAQQARNEVEATLARVQAQFGDVWLRAFASGAVGRPSVLVVATQVDRSGATRRQLLHTHTAWLQDRQFRDRFAAAFQLPDAVLLAHYDGVDWPEAARAPLVRAGHVQLAASPVSSPFAALLAAVDERRCNGSSQRLFLDADAFADAFAVSADDVPLLWRYLNAAGEAVLVTDTDSAPTICVEPQRVLLIASLFERMQQEPLVSKRSAATLCRYVQQQMRVPRTFTVETFCRLMQLFKLWSPIGTSHYYSPCLLPAALAPLPPHHAAADATAAALQAERIFTSDAGTDGFLLALRCGLLQSAVARCPTARLATTARQHDALLLQQCAHQLIAVTTESRPLDHPNLVKVIGVALAPGLLVATEPVERLSDHLPRRASPLDWPTRLQYLLDVAAGLQFLHDKSVAHGAVCTDHVVLSKLDVNSERTAKLCYLSAAVAPQLAAAPQWLAPERLADDAALPTAASDVYSFAMLLYALLTHDEPWSKLAPDTRRLVQQAQQSVTVRDRRPHPPPPQDPTAAGAPPDYWKLIEQCWDDRPANRPPLSHVRLALESFAATAAASALPPVSSVDSPSSSSSSSSLSLPIPSSSDVRKNALAALRISIDNVYSSTAVPMPAKCCGCERPLVHRYWARFCFFSGQWYCSVCHRNDRALIPARMVLGWDLSRYPVSKRAAATLQELYELPVIDVCLQNPQLYEVSSELNKIRRLREDLLLLTKFGTACPRYDWRQEFHSQAHLVKELHVYSMHDLVNRKNLSAQIDAIRRGFMAHIVQCTACRGRGHYCTRCETGELLFSFETAKINRCARCRAVFHKQCFDQTKDPCSTCERRETLRTQLRSPKNQDTSS